MDRNCNSRGDNSPVSTERWLEEETEVERGRCREDEAAEKSYLDLLLQGLDVVDDLVEHAGLAGDLAAPGHQLLQVLHPLADPLPPHLRNHSAMNSGSDSTHIAGSMPMCSNDRAWKCSVTMKIIPARRGCGCPWPGRGGPGGGCSPSSGRRPATPLLPSSWLLPLASSASLSPQPHRDRSAAASLWVFCSCHRDHSAKVIIPQFSQRHT
jgi:hypothetical protein